MNRRFGMFLNSVAAVGTLAFVPPLFAQQATDLAAPTPKNPILYSGFAVSEQQGQAGQIDITVERWTTDAERKGLLELLAGAEFKTGGQDKLLKALQQITPRTGFIRAPNSIGWDLKYAWKNTLPDGMTQIVIATDKPVSVLSATVSTRVLDYPFTLIEIRMGKDNKGEGRILAATAVSVKDGRLALEAYGLEPVKLTTVSEFQKKPKQEKQK